VHCLIGSEGTQVTPELFKELCAWEDETIGMVNYVTKGSNLYTEHYSAVKAEVPDPADSSTQLNQQLVDLLTEADIILVAGEALDYCVYNSIKDVASAFGVDNTKKIKILRNCTSAIDPNAVAKIEQEFGAMGIEFVTTDYFDK
jgi:nicotinamidase-related amidase